VPFAKNNWNGEVKEYEMCRACTTDGGGEECRLLVGKRPLRRPGWRWVDNIKMDLGPPCSIELWEIFE
jgi:hypothetical protein